MGVILLSEWPRELVYSGDTGGTYPNIERGSNMQNLPAKIIGTVVNAKERGATAVEYGIMVALIAAVIITAVTLIGTNLSTLFDSVGNSIKK